MRAEKFFIDHRVDLRLGIEAERIDRAARLVELSSGAGAAYDHLILATGARQRTAWIAGWCAAILRRALATFGFRNDLWVARRVLWPWMLVAWCSSQ